MRPGTPLRPSRAMAPDADGRRLERQRSRPRVYGDRPLERRAAPHRAAPRVEARGSRKHRPGRSNAYAAPAPARCARGGARPRPVKASPLLLMAGISVAPPGRRRGRVAASPALAPGMARSVEARIGAPPIDLRVRRARRAADIASALPRPCSPARCPRRDARPARGRPAAAHTAGRLGIRSGSNRDGRRSHRP